MLILHTITNITIIFRDRDEIPTNVKEFMLFFDKPLFVYPELLPIRTYHNDERTFPIGESEERYLPTFNDHTVCIQLILFEILDL